MKIVLSRKGFDGRYGGMASPILPSGRMLPLPIPSKLDVCPLAEANLGPSQEIDQLVRDLSKGRIRATTNIHLDPDLDRNKSTRPADWRPAFGQSGTAQTHLAKQGVGCGDLFLFFGWFRHVNKLPNGSWSYNRSTPSIHCLFGWLEIGDHLPIVTCREESLRKYPWIIHHPHMAYPDAYTDARNTLYIARTHSQYSTEAEFGAGRFPLFSRQLQLSKPGQPLKSHWSLPVWFDPVGERKPLTYHKNPDRWERDTETTVTLRSAPIGQEFVLDTNDYPEAESWVKSLFSNEASI